MTDNDIKKGIDRSNLDESVAPGTDFYGYACGGWQQKHPLPADHSRFGTFDLLRDNAREQLRDLILNLGESPEAKVKDTNAQKVSDLYALGMDEERLNREGNEPLQPMIRHINSFTPSQFPQLLAESHLIEGGAFFSTGVGADPKDSDTNIMYVGEMGLGLGDRDYYLEESEENRKILDAYEVYVKRIMTLSGYDEEAAERVWKNVIRLETEAARHKLTREERRNPLLRCNPRTMEELKAEFPNIPWEEYFKALGVKPVSRVNISSLAFLQWMDEYLPTVEWQTILDYLTYDAITGGSNLLSDDFSDANFEMFGRVMSGQEEPTPRWKRAQAIPNSMFGEAVGQLYVEKYFPQSHKEGMRRLVEQLRKALGQHISALTWMSDATKEQALRKLAGMTVKIGYPDKWKDYSELHVDKEKSYFENVVEGSKWYHRDNYSKMDKPVDKEEWLMTPQTVNAYYMPSTNEICFPAAILQPPYFDPDADDALNYGAIGVVIGHEMTHAFDDQGRQFDLDGNLNDWWTSADAEAFKALADKLADQFDQIEVAPGVHANGRFTLGENIADQGGLRVAHTAYHNSLEGRAGADIDGFSPDQRFYLAYANLWADNIRPEEILSRTKTDPHSLGRQRVNATLRNLEPFCEAFSITSTDPLFLPEDQRVIIW